MDPHSKSKLNPNKLFLSYSLIKRIKEVTGKEFDWKAGKNEGWRIEKDVDASYVFNVIFDNDEAKVMFLLKYGNGK